MLSRVFKYQPTLRSEFFGPGRKVPTPTLGCQGFRPKRGILSRTVFSAFPRQSCMHIVLLSMQYVQRSTAPEGARPFPHVPVTSGFPCATLRRLIPFVFLSYLIRLTPVSLLSIISPSGCICNTTFLYKLVSYSRIQLVRISTRFPPFLLLRMASTPSDKYGTRVVVQGTALRLSR